MFRTAAIQKNILIMIGILLLSYVAIFLLSPQDMTDYTVADTEYWRETNNRLMLKTSYDYNSKENVQTFPKTLREWKGYDFKYPPEVYKLLNADILLSRTYTKDDGSLVWMDIINSKVGESFHKQKICVEGAGWNVDKEGIAQFKIAEAPNPFTTLHANRLDYSKKGEKQVMIYWFMFKKFGSNDTVAMIRLTSPVISNESNAYDTIKDFVQDELFKALYKQAEPANMTVAENIMSTYGNLGIAAVAIGILLPLGLIFAGVRRKN